MITIKKQCVEIVYDKNILQLRSAEGADIEYLRELKNSHREYFFHRLEITQEQQAAWFATYQSRSNDYMFIVWLNGVRIGCMGIRLLDNAWDVYNVILGDQQYKGAGWMGRAFQAMLSFSIGIHQAPIGLSVLKNNPAIWWYKKNGFKVESESLDHFVMSFDSSLARRV
jgi:ribosomal protein S18 acetylase RimI-like enzyme